MNRWITLRYHWGFTGLFSILCFIQFEISAQQVKPFPSLVTFGNEQVANGTLAGGCVLILHRGEVVLHEAFGYSDLKSQKPFSKNAPVIVASISKPMLATALFRLHQSNQLDINAPIDRYLTEYRNAKLADGTPMKRLPSTIELLTHTAGALSFYKEGGRPWFASWTKGKTLAEVVKGYSVKHPFQTAPGTKYAYSGIGTDIAARVGEVASGLPRNEYILQELSLPLGLTTTAYREIGSAPDNMPTRYLISKESGKLMLPKKRDLPEKNHYSSSGGAIISTATDIATWLEMIRNSGTHRGKPYLKPETFAKFVEKSPKGSAVSGGLHAREFDQNGSPSVLGHSGSSGTDCWIDLENNITAVMLTQSGSEASKTMAKKVRATALEWAQNLE